MRIPHRRPFWARGWRAFGALISLGETGEGVKTVDIEAANSMQARRATRSLREAWLKLIAHGLRNMPTEDEKAPR